MTFVVKHTLLLSKMYALLNKAYAFTKQKVCFRSSKHTLSPFKMYAFSSHTYFFFSYFLHINNI